MRSHCASTAVYLRLCQHVYLTRKVSASNCFLSCCPPRYTRLKHVQSQLSCMDSSIASRAHTDASHASGPGPTSPSGSSSSAQSPLSATRGTQRAASTSALTSSLVSSATQTMSQPPPAKRVQLDKAKQNAKDPAESPNHQAGRILCCAFSLLLSYIAIVAGHCYCH